METNSELIFKSHCDEDIEIRFVSSVMNPIIKKIDGSGIILDIGIVQGKKDMNDQDATTLNERQIKMLISYLNLLIEK